MNIRRASSDDFASLLQLNKDLFTYEQQFTDSYNQDWTYSKIGKKYFQKRIDTGIVFVAEQEKKIVGYICGYSASFAHRAPEETAEIDNMFVMETYRDKDIGSQLMAEFEEEAKKRGAVRIKVGTYATNYLAQSFYKKNDFHSHEIIFEKEIAE